jgi:hypothetical protein
MGRVYEQIPHPKIAYAYLAIEADKWNEFENLRTEALKKHPLYGPSAFEQPTREAEKNVVAAEVAAEAAAGEPVPAPSGEAVSSAAEQASAATAPTEGLSPRDKAKAAIAAKKGA